MPNYKETNIAGTQWQRAVRIVVENPYNQTPSLNFIEEKVVILEDSIINNLCNNISIEFSPNEVIKLIDPATGLETGETKTHMDLYILLHSLYMQKAQERDILTGSNTVQV